MAPADICRPGGTTSACAENTIGHMREQRANRNYLRVRGEYCSSWSFTRFTGELPPRTRRIPAQATGLTPVTELPPRARRILGATMKTAPTSGTTSVCAENTSIHLINPLPSGNYLRVRGEYGSNPISRGAWLELPPRARRIQDLLDSIYLEPGTTSACAENTPILCRYQTTIRNYLRVRGEYISATYRDSPSMELPPRARRIQVVCAGGGGFLGTTSACAENTLPVRSP